VNIVSIGHVDHGKSTLIGRLLFDSGNIPEQEMRKLKEPQGAQEGDVRVRLRDGQPEGGARARGDDRPHVQGFDTPKHYFTKSTLRPQGLHQEHDNRGVPATQPSSCFAKDGIQDQTKEHVYLAKVLGINQVIVALNKMDAVDYAESKFKEVKETVTKLLQSVGYKIEKIPFIPLSAYMETTWSRSRTRWHGTRAPRSWRRLTST